MPAKISKQRKKRHSNRSAQSPNHRKKSLNADKSRKPKRSKLSNGHHPNLVNGHSDIIPNGGIKPRIYDSGDIAPHTANGKGFESKLFPKQMMNGQISKSVEERARESIALWQRRRIQSVHLADEFMAKHNFEMARVYYEQSLQRSLSRSKEDGVNTNSTLNQADMSTSSGTQLLPELPNELDIYCKLLVCRMHCDNSKTNLDKAVQEVNLILTKIPQSVQHHIIRAELNIRCHHFDEVCKCLLKAAERDQPDIIDSVHLYFHQIAENTLNTAIESDTLSLPISRREATTDQLCEFFNAMTLISQQNILSVEWSQIVDGIDSSLCDEIIDPLFSDNEHKERFKVFLQKSLKWNLPQNDQQQGLIFLKVEFAYILARTLWNAFKLPPKPNVEETKSMEDAIPIDCKPTYFLENGLFGCRDGYDFVSAAIFEPSLCLSSIFDVVNEDKVIINHQWLYPAGIKLLDWLAETPLYHVAAVRDTESEGWTGSDEEWLRFVQTRINAHYAIDPELNETVLSRDAHEDGKKFEEAMEQIVGKRKKNHLMQLELDLSIPILKKYAHIMSQISGIDEDVLIYELTLPDEEEKEREKERERERERRRKLREEGGGGDDEKMASGGDDEEDYDEPSMTSSLLKEYLNNPKFKDYKPLGLPVLVQNAEFNIVPSNSTKGVDVYDRKKILSALTSLEKEVVQFQIDYKNEVYKVAGDKATELDKVMSTLQYRGLELTKWLRNFVKYMIARRDIEQEIVDVSLKPTHKEAMNWFESMTNYLNGASNVLLKIVSKLLMDNLMTSYSKYPNEREAADQDDAKQQDDASNLNHSRKGPQTPSDSPTDLTTDSIEANADCRPNSDTTTPAAPNSKSATIDSNASDGDGDPLSLQCAKFEKYEIYPGKKIEKLSSKYFELDCLVKLYLCTKNRFDVVMAKETFADIESVKKFVNETLLIEEGIQCQKESTLSSLRMQSIRVALLEVQIPATIIENQYGAIYKSWIRYPLTANYLERTKLFMDRCKYLRDVPLCIIYSSVEKRCLLYATIQTSPNKHPKCMGCNKVFGALLCNECNLAHYCSVKCQRGHWDKFHKRECRKYKQASEATSWLLF